MIITIDTEKGRVHFSKLINEVSHEDIDLAFIMLDFAQGQIMVKDSLEAFKKRKGTEIQQEKWDQFLQDYKNSNL